MRKHIVSKLFYSICLLVVFFVAVPVSNAQFTETDISINSSPAYPKPGDSVGVRLSSYSLDLDKVFVVWSVDGEQLASGIGKKVFSFNINETNKRYQVSASIDLVGGGSILKEVFVTASAVDLLWEATDSYVPPFYRGKALVAREGGFRVVAIPTLSTLRGPVSPSNLKYQWKKDGNNQVSASGFGKNSLEFRNSYIDTSNQVEVEVTDIENTVKMGGKITLVGLARPKIILYPKDPVLGTLLNRTIGDGYQLGNEPETIVAAPYYFSPKNLDDNNLRFSWAAGGRTIQPTTKNEITVVAPSGGGGTDIRVVVENAKSLFQTLEKRINVKF